jgi:uncharacterized membrane protein YhaH (DUF805 family)
MKLFNAFFSFDGRIDRAGFFTRLGLACVSMAGLMGLATALLSSGMALGILYGLLLFGVALLVGLWSGAALVTQRMHDLELTAGHAAFVYGLNLFAVAFALYNPSIGVALTVFMVGASIWFLLTPGTESRNRFGSATGRGRVVSREIEPSFAERAA